ncbi:MAG: hypothetical protein ACR2QJ_06365 [Geminicoccaceae bacterium]
MPIEDFGGGIELNGGDICTECHAGENPYIIHPTTALGLPDLAGLPLFADDWHEPIVAEGWPENPGPADAPSVCSGCHTEGGPGGRLPAVSTDLLGYCGNVYDRAVERTMPPFDPGSQQGNAELMAFRAMCSQQPVVQPDVFRWAGAVWAHTGTPCSGQSCPGWQRLDNSVRTTSLAAGNGHLYQLHHDGRIWEGTGQGCSGNSCPGWQQLDNSARTVAIEAAHR